MRFSTCATLLGVVSLTISPAGADEKDTGWSSTAEFGLVVTAGNSESQTLAFKGRTIKKMDKSSFTLKAGAINAETTTTSRTAIGTPMSFVVNEVDTTDVSAESYYFEGRYDHEIHQRLFWFAGAGWNQSRPAGIDQRYTAFGGVGNVWRDDEKIQFRTDYAVSFTDQEDVVPSPSSVGSYIGVRASWAYEHQFTESTKYFNDFVVDFAVDDLDNFRADMLNAVQVAINSRLALKVSLQTLYNKLPPTELVALFDMAGPGGMQTGTVAFVLDGLDTIFSASVVVNF